MSKLTQPEVKKVKRGRGRPSKASLFNPADIKIQRNNELYFDPKLLVPMKTGNELDVILSTDGGLMPACNLIFVGGPGSGKTTVTLDILADLHNNGQKVLFVSGEMDEIGMYKYGLRLPKINDIPTLFLKNHMDNAKETLEYVFNEGYDVIAIDSLAEVLDMYKDQTGETNKKAESWLLNLQENHKKGGNKEKRYTSFINIQQVTKGDEFVGSNRLKHMTEGMCHISVSKDGLERTMKFSKNRDCDKLIAVNFAISRRGVFYSYEF